jgi:hypothetical protein
VELGSGILGVFGEFLGWGQPVSHSWVFLAEMAAAGDTTIIVDATVDWPVGAEIVISATDYDPHEAEVRTISGVAPVLGRGSRTALNLSSPLFFRHFAGPSVQFGTRQLQIRAEVGLLTRNIVIRGDGQGEETHYSTWNAQSKTATQGGPRCGNKVCEPGEDSRGCSVDCRGPAFEYGVGILVSSFTDDSAVCGRDGACSAGYRRTFNGTINVSNIELRYFGQNNLRPGLALTGLGDGGRRSTATNLSFNRGYFKAITVQGTSRSYIKGAVVYRAILPVVVVLSTPAVSLGNVIEGSLAVVGIFWNTHRGAMQVSFSEYVRPGGGPKKNDRQSEEIDEKCLDLVLNL